MSFYWTSTSTLAMSWTPIRSSVTSSAAAGPEAQVRSGRGRIDPRSDGRSPGAKAPPQAQQDGPEPGDEGGHGEDERPQQPGGAIGRDYLAGGRDALQTVADPPQHRPVGAMKRCSSHILAE